MKYIREKKVGIFLFPNTGGKGISHRDMLNFVLDHFENGEIISAGFVFSNKGGFICHGSSQSTGLNSFPEDTEILNKQFSN
jgi:hypothetical protein